jgi:hypothetical protein
LANHPELRLKLRADDLERAAAAKHVSARRLLQDDGNGINAGGCPGEQFMDVDGNC